MWLHIFTCAVVSAIAAAGSATTARGNAMCILFACRNFTTFHFGRVDFGARLVDDVMALPASLTGAEGGCAAGADDGQFYIPNANVAYNDLLEVNLLAKTTTSRTIAPPAAYAGTIPAFYTMQLNTAANDVWALFESSTVSWVATATVFPNNGTSVATSSNFRAQWLADFAWRKAGVAAVDSKRGLLFFVAGVPKGGANVETLVGVPVGDPAAPVRFSLLPGPSGVSADIDFLGYSAQHDLFVASCFSITTGVASIKTMPAGAGGAGGWATVFEWPQGAAGDFELGNGALAEDGGTLFVALTGSDGRAAYYAFEVPTGKLLANFSVADSNYAGLVTAEVVAC